MDTVVAGDGPRRRRLLRIVPLSTASPLWSGLAVPSAARRLVVRTMLTDVFAEVEWTEKLMGREVWSSPGDAARTQQNTAVRSP